MFARFISACLLALCATSVASAQGQSFENLDRIDSLVATTVGANIGEPGGALSAVDRRLRLKPCPATPSVEGPIFGAAMVKCEAMGWRIRVPLNLAGAAQASAYGMRVAAPREIIIRKGDPVRLIAGNSSFTVSRPMIADQDGAVGDTIRVRDDAKSPPVMARIENSGIVRVPGI